MQGRDLIALWRKDNQRTEVVSNHISGKKKKRREREEVNAQSWERFFQSDHELDRRVKAPERSAGLKHRLKEAPSSTNHSCP